MKPKSYYAALGRKSWAARKKNGNKAMKALRAKVKHPHIGKQDAKTGRFVKVVV